jgi:hypothetical protein
VHLALADGAHRLIVRADRAGAASLSIGANLCAERAQGEAMAFAPNGARLSFRETPAAAG